MLSATVCRMCVYNNLRKFTAVNVLLSNQLSCASVRRMAHTAKPSVYVTKAINKDALDILKQQ